jgi:hypothetical protein
MRELSLLRSRSNHATLLGSALGRPILSDLCLGHEFLSPALKSPIAPPMVS